MQVKISSGPGGSRMDVRDEAGEPARLPTQALPPGTEEDRPPGGLSEDDLARLTDLIGGVRDEVRQELAELTAKLEESEEARAALEGRVDLLATFITTPDSPADADEDPAEQVAVDPTTPPGGPTIATGSPGGPPPAAPPDEKLE